MQAYEAIWKRERLDRKFINNKISSIKDISPHWDVPNLNLPDISLEEILEWCGSLGLEGDLVELPVSQIASSKVFLLTSPKGSFIIKRPKAKLLFYKMFYPTNPNQEISYRPPRSRFKSEVLFSVFPLFKKPIAVNENLMLILSKKYYHNENAWDVQRIENLFRIVRQFQTTQTERFKSTLNTLPVFHACPSNWGFFWNYDERINELNAKFRNGARWFTPAHAEIELKRLKLVFSSNLFPISDTLEEILIRQNQMLLELITNYQSMTGIVWGECRPGHIIQADDGIFGIDAETCSIGESEIDFANFLWWFIDLRRGAVHQEEIKILMKVLNNMTLKERAYTITWIWLKNIFWLWWDIARGRKDRIANFISFFIKFDVILNENF